MSPNKVRELNFSRVKYIHLIHYVYCIYMLFIVPNSYVDIRYECTPKKNNWFLSFLYSFNFSNSNRIFVKYKSMSINFLLNFYLAKKNTRVRDPPSLALYFYLKNKFALIFRSSYNNELQRLRDITKKKNGHGNRDLVICCVCCVVFAVVLEWVFLHKIELKPRLKVDGNRAVAFFFGLALLLGMLGITAKIYAKTPGWES